MSRCRDETIKIFILATKAVTTSTGNGTGTGNQGINLSGADTVIVHDVDFNPDNDRQIEETCHRLDQSR